MGVIRVQSIVDNTTSTTIRSSDSPTLFNNLTIAFSNLCSEREVLVLAVVIVLLLLLLLLLSLFSRDTNTTECAIEWMSSSLNNSVWEQKKVVITRRILRVLVMDNISRE